MRGLIRSSHPFHSQDTAQVPPEMASHQFGNYTPIEACCACGGGSDLTQLQGSLVSWRLVLYGKVGDVVAEAPITPTETEVNGDGTYPPGTTPGPVAATAAPGSTASPGATPSPGTATNGTTGRSAQMVSSSAFYPRRRFSNQLRLSPCLHNRLTITHTCI